MAQIRWGSVALLAACATGESPPSTAPVVLSVTVQDETGAVASGIRIRVWRRDKGSDISLMPLEDPVRSDASGRATLQIATWPTRHMAESLTVATDPDFCQGLSSDTLIVPIRSDGGPIDGAEAVFQSPREAPLARLKVGQSCGVRFPPGYMSTLRLAFDTVGATLSGSWFLGHTQSIAPQAGRFSGIRIQDVVHLTLSPEPPACAGFFTMTARLGAQNELVDAELEADGECFVATAPPFYFVERDLGDWF